MSYEIIKKHGIADQSTTLAKRFGTLFEVSWFISPEDAGMHSTRDKDEAESVYQTKVAKIDNGAPIHE